MTQKNLLLLSEIKPSQETQFTSIGVTLFRPQDLNVTVDPAQINILYGWREPFGSQVLNAPGSQLEWVHAISAGVDYLPLAALTERQIKLTNASGIHATAISQSVLASILHFVRELDIAQVNKQTRHWADRDEQQPHVVADFNYAIFGTGHIGQQIARLLKAFGAHTIGVNTTGHSAPYFDETVAADALTNQVWQADVVVNVMPLTDATHHYFNQSRFNRFDPLFLFVNVGRGPVVDSTAVISAIKSGQIAHAALDVFETEPLPDDSPFWDLPNTLITPHNTGIINHFKQAQVSLFIPNLQQYLQDGTFKTNEVQLTKGY